MLTTVLKTLFTRDLNKLKAELELYRNEKNIWVVEKNIANTAGNLCLHLVGNLNAYLGAEIGGTGYIRNRDLEFSLKDLPRAELVSMVEATITVVNNALDLLTEEDMEKEYPLLVLPQKTSTEYFLVHLAAHLGYHLGQVNYHRRLLDV
ncbi:MAG: DUF1572 family protein [Lacibacter sp.]